jgi:hypothetical protein
MDWTRWTRWTRGAGDVELFDLQVEMSKNDVQARAYFSLKAPPLLILVVVDAALGAFVVHAFGGVVWLGAVIAPVVGLLGYGALAALGRRRARRRATRVYTTAIGDARAALAAHQHGAGEGGHDR